MNYSDIITQLDLVLPNTTELDYTKISMEDLWKKIEDFFRSIGLFDKISVLELNDLKNKFVSYTKYLYGMKSTIKGLNKSDDFDQNNYVIKNSINSLKRNVLDIVISKFYRFGFGDLFSADSELSIDEIAEKEYIFSHDEIEKYLRELFFVTKESIDHSSIDCEHFIDEILMRYFVISENDLDYHKRTDCSKLYSELRYEISSILSSASTIFLEYNNNVKRNTEHVRTFTIDIEKYNFEMEKSIKHLASLIEINIKNKISDVKMSEEKIFNETEKDLLLFVEQNGRLPHLDEPMGIIANNLTIAAEKREKGELLSRKDQGFIKIYDEVQKILNKREAVSVVNVKSENLQNEVIKQEEIKTTDVQLKDELVTDETLSDNFSILMSKYSEMQDLVARNKQIIQDIAEANKRIEELEKIKNELNAELEENNRKLGI